MEKFRGERTMPLTLGDAARHRVTYGVAAASRRSGCRPVALAPQSRGGCGASATVGGVRTTVTLIDM